MDNPAINRDKRPNGKTLIVAAVIIASILFLDVVFNGFSSPRGFGGFLKAVPSVTLESLREVFGAKDKGHLEAVINLDDGGNSDDLGDASEKNYSSQTSSVDGNNSDVQAGLRLENTSPSFISPGAAADCVFSAGENLSRKIIFNEIAWIGSPPREGENLSASSNNEWIELKNISGGAINLSGWSILDDSGKFKINFSDPVGVLPGSFLLLERTDDDSVPGAATGKLYTGAMPNAGMKMKLFDASCGLSDEVDASLGWPAGDNSTKQTMERDANNFGWRTSAHPGGTPAAENSVQ